MSDETTRPDDPTGGTKISPSLIRVVLTKEPDSKNRMEGFVESLPKWRDGTLVLAGLAYGLGYLSWAIYASDHGLGLAPVLDAQYFTAGILPATIVVASCFVAWWLRWLSQWIRKPVSGSGKTVKTILENAGVLFVATGFVLLLVSKWATQIPPAFVTASAISIVVGWVTIIVSSFFSREKTDAWRQRLVLGVAWAYLPFVGIIAFLLYTTRVFPGLPQAFGGPRPQCVQLDVDISKVSTNTLHLLAPGWQSGQTNQSDIVRSRSLYLIFQSSEYLFLQTSRQTSPTTNQVFKVKSSAVESLFPVADDVMEDPQAARAQSGEQRVAWRVTVGIPGGTRRVV